jgi:hypothetical protein
MLLFHTFGLVICKLMQIRILPFQFDADPCGSGSATLLNSARIAAISQEYKLKQITIKYIFHTFLPSNGFPVGAGAVVCCEQT